MKYKVGDKVKIREDLIVDNDYGSDGFVEEMAQYKGKTATITGAFMGKYDIDIDDGDWSWTDEMLEDYKSKYIVGDMKIDTIIKNMTVADLLNKTDVEDGGFTIAISYPSATCEVTIGHNYIKRDCELYKRFIAAYGDMIIDEISFRIKTNNVVMVIKADYCD
jgi:hypothetical protein